MLEPKKLRIARTFNIRLDLLQKLDREAPKGERSAFVEKLLIRELEKPLAVRQQMQVASKKKPQPPVQSANFREVGALTQQSYSVKQHQTKRSEPLLYMFYTTSCFGSTPILKSFQNSRTSPLTAADPSGFVSTGCEMQKQNERRNLSSTFNSRRISRLFDHFQLNNVEQ